MGRFACDSRQRSSFAESAALREQGENGGVKIFRLVVFFLAT